MRSKIDIEAALSNPTNRRIVAAEIPLVAEAPFVFHKLKGPSLRSEIFLFVGFHCSFRIKPAFGGFGAERGI